MLVSVPENEEHCMRLLSAVEQEASHFVCLAVAVDRHRVALHRPQASEDKSRVEVRQWSDC